MLLRVGRARIIFVLEMIFMIFMMIKCSQSSPQDATSTWSGGGGGVFEFRVTAWDSVQLVKQTTSWTAPPHHRTGISSSEKAATHRLVGNFISQLCCAVVYTNTCCYCKRRLLYLWFCVRFRHRLSIFGSWSKFSEERGGELRHREAVKEAKSTNLLISWQPSSSFATHRLTLDSPVSAITGGACCNITTTKHHHSGSCVTLLGIYKRFDEVACEIKSVFYS